MISSVSCASSYEGVEAFTEKYFYDQEVTFVWVPEAILFAFISTFCFVYFDMPFGFIFGFIATTHILTKRDSALLSPKFFSLSILSIVGMIFFLLTSIPFILNKSVLLTVVSLTYLMCIEGVIFKSLPGGGNELLQSINDSKGMRKVLPLVSFFISLWLFIRIFIVTSDSQFSTLQKELLLSASMAKNLGLILIICMFIIIVLGTSIKAYARNE